MFCSFTSSLEFKKFSYPRIVTRCRDNNTKWSFNMQNGCYSQFYSIFIFNISIMFFSSTSPPSIYDFRIENINNIVLLSSSFFFLNYFMVIQIVILYNIIAGKWYAGLKFYILKYKFVGSWIANELDTTHKYVQS